MICGVTLNVFYTATLGAYFLERLGEIRSDRIKEVRGRGLMLAIERHPDAGGARPVVEALRYRGVLAKETHGSTIRISPPLVISREQVDRVLEQLAALLT